MKNAENLSNNQNKLAAVGVFMQLALFSEISYICSFYPFTHLAIPCSTACLCIPSLALSSSSSFRSWSIFFASASAFCSAFHTFSTFRNVCGCQLFFKFCLTQKKESNNKQFPLKYSQKYFIEARSLGILTWNLPNRLPPCWKFDVRFLCVVFTGSGSMHFRMRWKIHTQTPWVENNLSFDL